MGGVTGLLYEQPSLLCGNQRMPASCEGTLTNLGQGSQPTSVTLRQGEQLSVELSCSASGSWHVEGHAVGAVGTQVAA
jgi:hypothetical protein